MVSVSRRKFLKISGAALGTVAAATGSAGFLAKGTTALAGKSDDKGIKKINTYCSLCFWKCGLTAFVRDGKLWKLEGNPKDPLSRGRLCPRGSGGVGAHYDPDRLKSPLIRVSRRGQDEWKAVTWDEALNYIARKMQKIKSDYGAESLAFFSHGPGGVFMKHTLKAFGTRNITAPSFAQCRGPRDVGFELTFGEDIGSPEKTDIKNARCMALIGSHLGENMHNSQVQEFAEAIGNGLSLVVVDPRFSVAAGKAKFYLPIKPGTDMALLLSWMNVLVSENLYDKEFVTNYGFGFDQFVAEIQPYTPEWAYIETGIEPELIRNSIRELAKNKPAAFVHPGRHVTWYGDDAQRSRAIALVNALLGNWKRKGGFFDPAFPDIPAYPYPHYPEPARGRADNPGKKYPFAPEAEGLTNGIREATITGSPYPIKGWFVYATNLLSSMPNQAETLKAIHNLDLLVVIDVVPSEIAGWADVVLPEAIYLERYDDLNITGLREPVLGIRQPVVDPPDDQKPNWWIAKKLAEKLGLGHYFPWKNAEEYLRTRVESAGFSYEELKENGVIVGPKPPNNVEEGLTLTFPTPSGKVEFYSLQLAENGFDPVPKYKKVEEPPAGYFRLLFGRAPVHTFGMTQTNRVLSDMMAENEAWINSDVADRYGLKSGDYISLVNQDGIKSSKIKVKATQRIRQDCIYMVHGFGHEAKGLRGAYMKGASDSKLVSRYNIDPIMGGTGMNVNFVTIGSEEA